MKRIGLFFIAMLLSVSAHAQYTVIRGVNPSNAFVNLNADASGNLVVTATSAPAQGTATDKSGSITSGGTSQVLSTAHARRYLFIQNTSSANLYINFTSPASAASGSIIIVPNGSFVMESGFITSEAVNIFGATTGQTFTTKEF